VSRIMLIVISEVKTGYNTFDLNPT